MSKSIQTDKSFVKMLTLLMVIYGIQQGESHIAELLFEEEEAPVAVATNLNHLTSAHAVVLPQVADDLAACHVEFTVVKRAAGRCIAIGKALKACVSGTYIHPFHPDCM